MARAARHELVRPILVSNVTTALGFGLLAVIPVTPVQEMALFGAAGELLSGLHVVFVLPKCLLLVRRRRRARQQPRRSMRVNAGRPALLARSPPGSRGCSASAIRLLVPMVAACAVVAWLISTVSYDSTYLNMIQPNERLRARLRALRRGRPAQRPAEHRHPAQRPAPIVDAALNAAIVKRHGGDRGAAGGHEGRRAGVDLRRGRAGAGRTTQPLAQFAADDASVTDAYIFALSGGNTEIGSYVHDGLGAYRLVVFFPYLDNSRLEQLTQHEIPSILEKHFGDACPTCRPRISGVTGALGQHGQRHVARADRERR